MLMVAETLPLCVRSFRDLSWHDGQVECGVSRTPSVLSSGLFDGFVISKQKQLTFSQFVFQLGASVIGQADAPRSVLLCNEIDITKGETTVLNRWNMSLVVLEKGLTILFAVNFTPSKGKRVGSIPTAHRKDALPHMGYCM